LLLAAPVLAEAGKALRKFELSDGSIVTGTVLDELESGYLVRTQTGETVRLLYSRVVSVADVTTDDASPTVIDSEAEQGVIFPLAAQLEVGFGALPWGLSPVEAKSTLEIHTPFVIARNWQGFTFSSEVGVLVDRFRVINWDAERALVFSRSGLTRVQVQFDAAAALGPVRDWVSKSLGAPVLHGDSTVAQGPLKYTWFDGRVFLVRQPMQEGSYVALNVLAPPQLERGREEQALRREVESASTLRARARGQAMRDGGGGMIALGAIMQATGVILAVAGVMESNFQLAGVGTAVGLSGVPVIGIGIPVHVVGMVRYRKSLSDNS